MFSAATVRAARVCGCPSCKYALDMMEEEEVLVQEIREDLANVGLLLLNSDHHSVVERITDYGIRAVL